MIEALNVPHTEVEPILVNVESADFNRILQRRMLNAVILPPCLTIVARARSLFLH